MNWRRVKKGGRLYKYNTPLSRFAPCGDWVGKNSAQSHTRLSRCRIRLLVADVGGRRRARRYSESDSPDALFVDTLHTEREDIDLLRKNRVGIPGTITNTHQKYKALRKIATYPFVYG